MSPLPGLVLFRYTKKHTTAWLESGVLIGPTKLSLAWFQASGTGCQQWQSHQGLFSVGDQLAGHGTVQLADVRHLRRWQSDL